MSDAYVHKSGSFEFWSVVGLVRSYRIPGDRVCHVLNVWPGNKDVMTPNPLTKEESGRVYTCDDKAYQHQIDSGFSKVCEIFKFHGIESLKYVREFYTPVYYCGDIFTPRNVTLNEINCDWLFDTSVASWAGALASESYHRFQTVWLRETRSYTHWTVLSW